MSRLTPLVNNSLQDLYRHNVLSKAHCLRDADLVAFANAIGISMPSGAPVATVILHPRDIGQALSIELDKLRGHDPRFTPQRPPYRLPFLINTTEEVSGHSLGSHWVRLVIDVALDEDRHCRVRATLTDTLQRDEAARDYMAQQVMAALHYFERLILDGITTVFKTFSEDDEVVACVRATGQQVNDVTSGGARALIGLGHDLGFHQGPFSARTVNTCVDAVYRVLLADEEAVEARLLAMDNLPDDPMFPEHSESVVDHAVGPSERNHYAAFFEPYVAHESASSSASYFENTETEVHFSLAQYRRLTEESVAVSQGALPESVPVAEGNPIHALLYARIALQGHYTQDHQHDRQVRELTNVVFSLWEGLTDYNVKRVKKTSWYAPSRWFKRKNDNLRSVQLTRILAACESVLASPNTVAHYEVLVAELRAVHAEISGEWNWFSSDLQSVVADHLDQLQPLLTRESKNQLRTTDAVNTFFDTLHEETDIYDSALQDYQRDTGSVAAMEVVLSQVGVLSEFMCTQSPEVYSPRLFLSVRAEDCLSFLLTASDAEKSAAVAVLEGLFHQLASTISVLLHPLFHCLQMLIDLFSTPLSDQLRDKIARDKVLATLAFLEQYAVLSDVQSAVYAFTQGAVSALERIDIAALDETFLGQYKVPYGERLVAALCDSGGAVEGAAIVERFGSSVQIQEKNALQKANQFCVSINTMDAAGAQTCREVSALLLISVTHPEQGRIFYHPQFWEDNMLDDWNAALHACFIQADYQSKIHFTKAMVAVFQAFLREKDDVLSEDTFAFAFPALKTIYQCLSDFYEDASMHHVPLGCELQCIIFEAKQTWMHVRWEFSLQCETLEERLFGLLGNHQYQDAALCFERLCEVIEMGAVGLSDDVLLVIESCLRVLIDSDDIERLQLLKELFLNRIQHNAALQASPIFSVLCQQAQRWSLLISALQQSRNLLTNIEDVLSRVDAGTRHFVGVGLALPRTEPVYLVGNDQHLRRCHALLAELKANGMLRREHHWAAHLVDRLELIVSSAFVPASSLVLAASSPVPIRNAVKEAVLQANRLLPISVVISALKQFERELMAYEKFQWAVDDATDEYIPVVADEINRLCDTHFDSFDDYLESLEGSAIKAMAEQQIQIVSVAKTVVNYVLSESNNKNRNKFYLALHVVSTLREWVADLLDIDTVDGHEMILDLRRQCHIWIALAERIDPISIHFQRLMIHLSDLLHSSGTIGRLLEGPRSLTCRFMGLNRSTSPGSDPSLSISSSMSEDSDVAPS